jgi:hypothetical protein
MQNKNKKRRLRKLFIEAVEETPEVSGCYCPGKGGILKKERNKVELTDSQKCGGSLFIDQCLSNQGLYPNDHRWDYAIDYCSEVFFIEVHTANTGEVGTVLNKLAWLKDWLNNKAPEINALKATTKTPFYWVQSKGYHILPNSRQERIVLQNGLKPISKLVLI